MAVSSALEAESLTAQRVGEMGPLMQAQAVPGSLPSFEHRCEGSFRVIDGQLMSVTVETWKKTTISQVVDGKARRLWKKTAASDVVVGSGEAT